MIQVFLHRQPGNILIVEKERNNLPSLNENVTYRLQPLSGLRWSTAYKSQAGILQLEILNEENIYCDIGDIIELYAWDKEDEEPKRVLRYRILEIELSENVIKLVAYDQLIHLIRSKETIKVERIRPDLLGSEFSFISNNYKNKMITNTAKFTEEYRKIDDHCADNNPNYIIPSEIVLQLIHRYQLLYDPENLYYDDYDKNTVALLKPRIAVNEKPIDILQSYMNLYMVHNNKIYTFYDGGNGICYVPLEKRKTNIYYDDNDFISYSLRQKLSDNYASVTGFIINTEKIETNVYKIEKLVEEQIPVELPSPPHPPGTIVYESKKRVVTYTQSDRKKIPITKTEIYTYSKAKTYGIFYVSEEIKALTTYDEKTKKEEVVFTEEQVMNLRKLYYESLQHPIYDLQLTIGNGNWNVRGGSIIGLMFHTFNHKKIFIEVVVESIEHIYNSDKDHIMNITVKGTNL